MFLRNLPKSVRHISRHTSKLNKTQARNVHILRTNTPEQLQDAIIGGKRMIWTTFLGLTVGCYLINKYTGDNVKTIEVFDPVPKYLQINIKPYPWFCSECSLFNRKCWKQCKALEKKKKELWNKYLEKHPEKKASA